MTEARLIMWCVIGSFALSIAKSNKSTVEWNRKTIHEFEHVIKY